MGVALSSQYMKKVGSRFAREERRDQGRFPSAQKLMGSGTQEWLTLLNEFFH